MVRVQGSTNFSPLISSLRPVGQVELGDFFIDKFEVSNKQFKEFVDKGEYQKTNVWLYPFIKSGTTLSWEKAISQFRDQTGQPGPAMWSNGSYPSGQADFPVTGVSWYEAAAYAQFSGKRLPTIFHWYRAAGTDDYGPVIFNSPQIVPLSNFDKQGLAPVGKYPGMSSWGAYDMAGNADEWCWNESASRKRYTLGGGWDSPAYKFFEPDEADPFDRPPTLGFRCMKDLSQSGISKVAFDPVARQFRDYTKEKPVSDEVFQVLRSSFSYDKTAPLDPIVEPVPDGSELWKKERITFKAAYGEERVPAYLFLPKKISPPYQTLIYFPGVGAFGPRSSKTNLASMNTIAPLL